MNRNETKLLERALNGDKSAFNALIASYHSYCLNKAKRIVRDYDVAEDMVQIAFIEAYFCLGNLKDTSSFKFWLGGIVTNTCKNQLRLNKRQHLSLQAYYTTLHNSELTNDEKVIHVVLTAIKQLNKADTDIIESFYYEKKHLAEIAKEMGITENTAKVRLHRARVQLKLILERDNSLIEFQQYMLKKSDMKKVEILDFVVKATTDERCAILLYDKDSEKVLTVVISLEEAEAIVRSLKKINMPRPMTLDLIAEIIKNTNTSLVGAYINSLSSGIFIATIKIKSQSETKEFDARPSDAIAIALRFDAPIYVSQKVMDSAGFPVVEKYKHLPIAKKGIELITTGITEKISQISLIKAASRKAIPKATAQSNFDAMMEFVFDSRSGL